MLLSTTGVRFDGRNKKLGFQLWKLNALWQRELNTMLKGDNLTHAQYLVLEALFWLSEEREVITQIDIARSLEVDPMLVSNLVRALEEKTLVKRLTDTKDTRAKKVVLTGSGNFLIKKVMPEVEKFDATFFSNLVVNAKQFEEQINSLLQNKVSA